RRGSSWSYCSWSDPFGSVTFRSQVVDALLDRPVVDRPVLPKDEKVPRAPLRDEGDGDPEDARAVLAAGLWMVGEAVTGARLIGTSQVLPELRSVQHGTGVVGDCLLGVERKSAEAVAHRHHLTKRQQTPTGQRGLSPAST